MTTIRTLAISFVIGFVFTGLAFILVDEAKASDNRPTVVVTVDRDALGVCEEPNGWDVLVHANGRTHLMVGSSHEITSATGHFGPVSVSARCGERSESVTADMTFLNL